MKRSELGQNQSPISQKLPRISCQGTNNMLMESVQKSALVTTTPASTTCVWYWNIGDRYRQAGGRAGGRAGRQMEGLWRSASAPPSRPSRPRGGVRIIGSFRDPLLGTVKVRTTVPTQRRYRRGPQWWKSCFPLAFHPESCLPSRTASGRENYSGNDKCAPIH